MRKPTSERFWEKVRVLGPDDCWPWMACKTHDGYGRFRLAGKHKLAHIWSYEADRGFPVPTGLELDHLCRVRHCVNPKHLEPVTRRVNLLRGVGVGAMAKRTGKCKRGHANWYSDPTTGWRSCRTCRAASQTRRRAGKRGKP